ncbi:MAG: hypothetical protein KF718_07455 [Polyangiaceae bacterium]|nr:hypothetical protein [Polyangiaceae bacterium]
MASKKRELFVDAPAHITYGLARAAGSEIGSFRLVIDNPTAGFAKFSRGFGLTNPMDVIVTVTPVDEQRCSVVYEASILALVDPFGFLGGALDVFSAHLENHRQAWATGTPPPAAPKDKRPLVVTLGCLGLVLGGTAVMLLVIVVLSLL